MEQVLFLAGCFVAGYIVQKLSSMSDSLSSIASSLSRIRFNIGDLDFRLVLIQSALQEINKTIKGEEKETNP